LVRLQALDHFLTAGRGAWMVTQRRPIVPTGTQRAAHGPLEIVHPPDAGGRQFRLIALEALQDPSPAGLDIGAERPDLLCARHLLPAHLTGYACAE
jgi:hypothetical protein